MHMFMDCLKSSLKVMKKHYFVFVIICVLSMLIGGEFLDTQNFSRIALLSTSDSKNVDTETDKISIYTVLNYWHLGEDEESIQTSKELMDQIVNDGLDNRYLKHSSGVLAEFVNKITSGYFFVELLIHLANLFHSRDAAKFLVLLLLLSIFVGWFVFVRNICIVIARRIVLEGRIYKKLSFTRVRFGVKSGKIFHIAWVMVVSFIRQVLWAFIVVGIVKRYSYYLVPYIMAENPSLTANQAIALSRTMMKGHKLQLCIYDLCFLLTPGISLLTGGVSDILFFNPLRITFFSEYYVRMRSLAKENHIAGIELLADDYLYCQAEKSVLEENYGEVCKSEQELSEKIGAYDFKHNRAAQFFIKYFGVSFWESKEEKEYERNLANRSMIESKIDQLNGNAYPVRLGLTKEKEAAVKKADHLCHYSIWTLIALFLIFAMIGWVWEVTLHLFSDGTFVNRGMLHGPWLPIYGAGGILMLIVPYRLRNHPGLEFSAIVLLAGSVEFLTSFVLEITQNGARWWDYTGYFINFNGRICAEGLLVFGIGGMAVVYGIALRLNHLFRKIDCKKLAVISMILLTIFLVDLGYSHAHPNTGEGITTGCSDKKGAVTLWEI